jgi:predicted DNA-binding transcriptional regulator AlpA
LRFLFFYGETLVAFDVASSENQNKTQKENLKMTKVTVSKAGLLTGISIPTLYKHINDGKLPFSLNFIKQERDKGR